MRTLIFGDDLHDQRLLISQPSSVMNSNNIITHPEFIYSYIGIVNSLKLVTYLDLRLQERLIATILPESMSLLVKNR